MGVMVVYILSSEVWCDFFSIVVIRWVVELLFYLALGVLEEYYDWVGSVIGQSLWNDRLGEGVSQWFII